MDLKQEGVCNVYSEVPKRKLQEMGNVELYEHTSFSYMLATFLKRRDSLLRVRQVSDTLAGTYRTNQKSNRHHLTSSVPRQTGSTWSAPWT